MNKKLYANKIIKSRFLDSSEIIDKDLRDDIEDLFNAIPSCWKSLAQSIDILNEYTKYLSLNKKTSHNCQPAKFKFLNIDVPIDYLSEKAKSDIIFQLDNFRVIFFKLLKKLDKTLNTLHSKIKELLDNNKLKFIPDKNNKDIDILMSFRNFFHHTIEREVCLEYMDERKQLKKISKEGLYLAKCIRYDDNNIFIDITHPDGVQLSININDIIDPLFDLIKDLVDIFSWDNASLAYIDIFLSKKLK